MRKALLIGGLLVIAGCSTAPPATNTEAVRQDADSAFHDLKAQEQQKSGRSSPPDAGETVTSPAPSAQDRVPQDRVQIPPAEIDSSEGDTIRATGYGPLAKGLTLCQYSADLAARVELSKLIRVQVTEKSVDRIRERTGKDAEQDIEVIREGYVNEVLSDVRIIDRKIDKEAGTCSSTAAIPRRNLFPSSGSQMQKSSPTGK